MIGDESPAEAARQDRKEALKREIEATEHAVAVYDAQADYAATMADTYEKRLKQLKRDLKEA